jgi:DNA mismatch repair ATPase MutS
MEEPKDTNILGKMKKFKTSSMEAAYNEKVYLLLSAVLKEEKHFNVESDNQIKIACNRLYTTWGQYLDNDSHTTIQLEQLKAAYSKCEPLVVKKLKDYTKEKAREVGIRAQEGVKAAQAKGKVLTKKASEVFLNAQVNAGGGVRLTRKRKRKRKKRKTRRHRK